jgi:ADP-heptose:LPS heptosyltransferase
MASQRFPILFIAPSRIGDAVLSSGLVRALTDEIEAARFTIAGSALTTPLFAEVPGLARTIIIEKRPLGGHWFDLWNAVRRQRWGLVVDLRGSGLARFLRARRRATHRSGGPMAHKVAEAARLLKLEDDPPAPFLYTSPETEARAAELTAGKGPILAIAPAANWVGKTWPAERFGLVARDLLGPNGPLAGGRLMLLGGPDDRKLALTLRAALPKERVIDLVGRESLLVSYAALKRARLFIGADSGLMHMAAAAGAPTLGLFGPSDERLFAPWGPQGRTVRGARSFEEIRALDPQLNQQICHMMELRVDAVTAAARRLIAETEAPSGRESAAENETRDVT